MLKGHHHGPTATRAERPIKVIVQTALRLSCFVHDCFAVTSRLEREYLFVRSRRQSKSLLRPRGGLALHYSVMWDCRKDFLTMSRALSCLIGRWNRLPSSVDIYIYINSQHQPQHQQQQQPHNEKPITAATPTTTT